MLPDSLIIQGSPVNDFPRFYRDQSGGIPSAHHSPANPRNSLIECEHPIGRDSILSC